MRFFNLIDKLLPKQLPNIEFMEGWAFDENYKVVFSEFIQQRRIFPYDYPRVGCDYWHCYELGTIVHKNKIFKTKQQAIECAKIEIKFLIETLQKALEELCQS